jgi:hypothetical protein
MPVHSTLWPAYAGIALGAAIASAVITALALVMRRDDPIAHRPPDGVAANAERRSRGVRGLPRDRRGRGRVIAERMRELGIVLPPVFPPVGNYLGCVVDGHLVWVGGHGPVDGERTVTGKVGADLSLEQAREAARMTGLSILATLQAELGDLDRIERIVRVFGMVNCAPGFNQTPAVIDGSEESGGNQSVRGGPVCGPPRRGARLGVVVVVG